LNGLTGNVGVTGWSDPRVIAASGVAVDSIGAVPPSSSRNDQHPRFGLYFPKIDGLSPLIDSQALMNSDPSR